MTDYDRIILELREKNKKSRGENKRLQLLINDLIKSNDELKQKLAYYENPHSPPSQNSLQWRKQKAEKRQKNNGKSNRGGVPGHKGATQKFIPQRVQHHKLSVCPRCHGTDITAIKPKRCIMVAIPPPQQYKVTEHVLHRYNCKTCNCNFSNDGNLPQLEFLMEQ